MQQYKTRPFMKSLRGKIVLQMLLVSLIPIILVGGLVYNSMATTENSANDSVDDSRSALKEDTVAATKASQAWNISIDLETWIASKIWSVEKWALNSTVIDAARYAGDDASGSTARAAAEGFLGQKALDDSDIADVYIVGANSDILVQIPQGKPETNESEAMGALWGDLYVSVLQSAEGMGVSYPYYIDIGVLVEDITTNAPLGVLVVSVKVHPSSMAEEYGMKVPSSELAIWAPYDDDYKLIIDSATPDRYSQEVTTFNDAEKYVYRQIGSPSTSVLNPAIVLGVSDPIAGYARASNSYDVAGVPFQFAAFEGLGWVVMVSQDAETALKPLESLDNLESDLNDATNTMLFTLLGVIVGLLILVPIVAFYLSRGITGPVASLRDAAEKVSMGDMSVVLSVESDDEIGDLAQSFDRMVMAVRFLSQEEEE